jgi:hypothetical protein
VNHLRWGLGLVAVALFVCRLLFFMRKKAAPPPIRASKTTAAMMMINIFLLFGFSAGALSSVGFADMVCFPFTRSRGCQQRVNASFPIDA